MENCLFNMGKLVRNIVQTWEARLKQGIKDMVEQVSWARLQVLALLRFVRLNLAKKVINLVNTVPVAGNQVLFG